MLAQPNNVTYIYGLYDEAQPDLIMYVGKADNVQGRLRTHKAIAANARHNKRFHRWIREHRVAIKVLEQVTRSNWEEREIYWICQWRHKNPKLLNILKGGQGSWEAGRPGAGFAGEVFGQLTLIKIAGRSSNGSIDWWCECSCGRMCRRVRYANLRTGNPRCRICSRPQGKLRWPHNKAGQHKWTPEERAANAERVRKRNLSMPPEQRRAAALARNEAKRAKGVKQLDWQKQGRGSNGRFLPIAESQGKAKDSQRLALSLCV